MEVGRSLRSVVLDKNKIMIYFKNIKIENIDSINIEKRLRKSSARFHTSLDFKSSTFQTLDKRIKFMGYENTKSFQISRIRFFLENFLPKLIVKFDKSDFTYYKLRLSFITTFIALFFLLVLLINLFYYLSDGSSSTLKEISGFLALYLISIYTEVLRTKNRIIKSINI